MSSLEIRTQINQRLWNLSQEQLNTVLEFIESIEPLDENNKNQQKTVIEKMGGYPKFLLQGTGNLSDRDVCKKIIGDRMKDKYITDTSHQNEPLEPFIGIIDTKGSDWVENHNQYLGQTLLDTHDNE
ncbi:hypothetical protein [Crocosphaera sp. XPORK-15E]|uniref:hypothetical protein n=1 Tax=Crocosphaera sp. XPORK-15E TaxID=3110247 RepID=UPI002B21858F|nr:hypothetical protein [Crocosphaera sp. XPORK-15E]MEA5535094.1 hypothetical protein [Crocosphaera sp. XPORK-15E]